MLRVILVGLCVLLLMGCAPRHQGVDWFAYTEKLEANGNMRIVRYPEDAPVDADLLAQNFERLAFKPEQDSAANNQHLLGAEYEFLRKWRRPVNYVVIEQLEGETEFKRKVSRFTKRLHLLTGVTIALTKPKEERGPDDPAANLMVIYGSDHLMYRLALMGPPASKAHKEGDAKRDFLKSLAARIRDWRKAPSPCAGTAYIAKESKDGYLLGEVLGAVIYIRSEIPETLLEACVEEELAQVFGIINDDLAARPSIFNDDQEFARLTFHDEMLLRLLYDQRLEVGMPPDEAMPIVRKIARELIPEG